MAITLADAVACYEASTSYVDANYRKKWEYSLRAFQNEHAPGSKYLSDEYKGRSKLFRPKTRSVIRKNEAAAFMTIGNLDDLSILPEDPDNAYAAASAEAMKALLRYRLSKTIPWPLVVAGAMQDAQTVGVVCSYNYWEYEQKIGADGMRTVIKDRPCIKLRPIENIRIDPAADWLDPVNSSPYFIDIIPMYVCDVKRMMKTEDPKTGRKWRTLDDKEIARGMPDMIDSTRQVRQGRSQQDPYLENRSAKDHDIVWVMKYFMRDDGEDLCFYTLGTHALLSDPLPVDEVYFHGRRPYTIGHCVLETHKAMPDGPTWMSRDLQREMNDNVNSRMDNVKLVLNKRYLVGRGRQVDVQSLLRNVPGGVTLATSPKEDVVPLEWNDVTQSAYAEQDKLGQDFDDLVGNFSPNTRFANVGMSETLGGSKMAMQGASAMTEYQIQTLVATWVEPTLRQMMMLEQYYETDERILAICGKNARLFQKFGIDRVTDSLLMQELALEVNFGPGSTNPEARLQKFIAAVGAVNQIIQTAPPGANVQEMVSEVFRNAGYRNGDRFYSSQIDPRIPMAFQKIQQLQSELQSKRYEADLNAKVEMQKAALQTKTKNDEIKVNAARIDLDANIRNKEVVVSEQEARAKMISALAAAQSSEESGKQRMLELVANAANLDARNAAEDMRVRVEQDRLAHEKVMKEREAAVTESNEQRISAVVEQVGKAFSEVGAQVNELKSDLSEAAKSAEKVEALQQAMLEMAQGMAALIGNVQAIGNKPKPKGWKKKNENGRKSIIIMMDDGSEQEMMEQ